MVVWSLQLWYFCYRLGIDEAHVSRLILHLFDTSSHYFWAIVANSAPQLRFSTLVTKTERYCCWTDWVFFWEDHAFSYKDVCLIPSTLSVMFFYRLVFDGAVIFRIVLLLLHTSSPFLGPTIRVALLHHWDVLPWLLRQSDIGAGLIGSSSEKAMRSATNMVVWSVQLCHWCFFTG